MYNVTDKISCDCCDHKEVCALKQEFRNAQESIDSIMVHLGDKMSKRLRDFSWIEPVYLKCTHFSDRNQPITKYDDILK